MLYCMHRGGAVKVNKGGVRRIPRSLRLRGLDQACRRKLIVRHGPILYTHVTVVSNDPRSHGFPIAAE